MGPEIIIGAKVLQLIGDRHAAPLVETNDLQLLKCFLCQVAELDTSCIDMLCSRCRLEIDRNTPIRALLAQMNDIFVGRDIDVKHVYSF